QLLQGLGYAFPTRAWSGSWGEDDAAPRPLKALARRTATKALRRAGASRPRCGPRRPSILFDLPCRASDAWRLAWRTKLRAVPLDGVRDVHRPVPAASFDERRRGLARVAVNGHFEQLAAGLLPHHLPRVYLEGYGPARERALAAYGGNPRVITVSDRWYFDDAFRFWAAESAARGSRLVAVQD